MGKAFTTDDVDEIFEGIGTGIKAKLAEMPANSQADEDIRDVCMAGLHVAHMLLSTFVSLAESQRVMAEESKQIMEVSADMRDPSKWQDVKPKSFQEDLSDLLCRHWKPGVRADLVSELEIASSALVNGDDPTMPF